MGAMPHFQGKVPILWYQRSNATDVWEQVMHLQIAISNQQCVINVKCHKTGHIIKACQTRDSTKQIKQPPEPSSQKSLSQKPKTPMSTIEESPSSQS